MAEDSQKNRKTEQNPIEEKLFYINRVAKVVKGGRRFGFAALVVAGDRKGRVGFGQGKAREVPEAVRKASQAARNAMIKIPLREARTLHHDAIGNYGAGKVMLRTAPPGTGIIAGGAMRALFEMLGVQDIVAKSIGSSSPYNVVRATMNALQKETSPRNIANRRALKPRDILNSKKILTGDAAAEVVKTD